MYFEIYRQATGLISGGIGALPSNTVGQWRWRLRGANHHIIASGESYHNEKDCLHAIDLVKGTTTTTPVKHVT